MGTNEPRYSVVYRIMHWAMALCMLFLLFTIFLRTTWMNKDNMADIIQPYLSNAGTPLDRDEAIVLAKRIRQPMWQWHSYIGYALVGLYAIRLALPLAGVMRFPNPTGKARAARGSSLMWCTIR